MDDGNNRIYHDGDSLGGKTLAEVVSSIQSGLMSEKLQYLYNTGQITVKGWTALDNPELLKSVFEDERFIKEIRESFAQTQKDYLGRKAAYDEFERRLQGYQQEK